MSSITPVIGKHGRSFGSRAASVASSAGCFIDGIKQAGVATTLKRFPGHGTSRGDSHNGFVDITSTWSSDELRPFNLLAAKAQVVMGAIRNNFSLQEAVIYALQAGNDMLLMSNSLKYDPQLSDRVAGWVVGALDKGTLRPATLAGAYARVMRLKQNVTFDIDVAGARI